jgi:hypothetical protein
VNPPQVSFGVISAGDVRTRPLTVRNAGRGYLYGSAQLAALGIGLTLDRHLFHGNALELVLTLDLPNARSGTHRTTVTLDTNGGPLAVPVTWFVREEPGPPWWQRLVDGLLE